MKYLLYSLLPFALSLHAQESANSQFILRSTIGISSVSSDQPPQHIFQQSTGQSSVIGTFAGGEHMLHQGFVQASVWQNMALTGEEIDLKAKTYPNPFYSNLNISFNELVKHPIFISIHDELGRELQSDTYKASQNILLNLAHLSSGKYYIKIEHNKHFFINQLVKFK